MDNFFINLGITTVLAAIKEAIKNPQKKEDLKKALKKVRDSINLLYADDPDFQ